MEPVSGHDSIPRQALEGAGGRASPPHRGERAPQPPRRAWACRWSAGGRIGQGVAELVRGWDRRPGRRGLRGGSWAGAGRIGQSVAVSPSSGPTERGGRGAGPRVGRIGQASAEMVRRWDRRPSKRALRGGPWSAAGASANQWPLVPAADQRSWESRRAPTRPAIVAGVTMLGIGLYDRMV